MIQCVRSSLLIRCGRRGKEEGGSEDGVRFVTNNKVTK